MAGSTKNLSRRYDFSPDVHRLDDLADEREAKSGGAGRPTSAPSTPSKIKRFTFHYDL